MSSVSLKKNYLYRLFYEILTMLTPLLTAPYIARVLGAKGIGTYSYASSYISYFTMFAALGTASYGMREISRNRNSRYMLSKIFWEIELLSIITTSISLLGWMIFILLNKDLKIYFVALIPQLIATMFDISWFYTGQEKVGYTVFWNATCKILGIACIFLFVKKTDDLFIYILINSLFLLIGNVSMWISLPKFLVRINKKNLNIKKHFKETLVYFIPTVATSIYLILDKTLIGLITKDSYQNGYYEQANKIIGMAKTVVFVSVNSIMEARISYLFVENKIEEIKTRIYKTMSFIFLLGIGAMFGIISVADNFVPIFFGNGYEPVITLLYVMSPLIIIIGVSNCLGSHYYTPAGLRKTSSKYIIMGAFINLLGNLILIPRLGAMGAVLGSILAELTISGLYLVNSNGFLTFTQIFKCSYKRFFAGCLMLITIKIFENEYGLGFLNLCIEILIGIIIYFVTLLLLKDKLLIDMEGTVVSRFIRYKNRMVKK